MKVAKSPIAILLLQSDDIGFNLDCDLPVGVCYPILSLRRGHFTSCTVFSMGLNSSERKAHGSSKEPGDVLISISFHSIDELISSDACYFPVCWFAKSNFHYLF